MAQVIQNPLFNCKMSFKLQHKLIHTLTKIWLVIVINYNDLHFKLFKTESFQIATIFSGYQKKGLFLGTHNVSSWLC